MKSQSSLIYIYLLLIIVVILGRFGSIVRDPRTHTVDTLRDLRWETVSDDLSNPAPAVLLDCDRVETCFSKGVSPDQYVLAESKEELYVWSYEYQRSDLETPTTVFYVVVNRPTESTWDMAGFEYVYGYWQVGAYGGHGENSTTEPKWHTKTISLDPSFEGQTIAIGLTTEDWAVLVKPTSQTTFSYSVVEFYWK